MIVFHSCLYAVVLTLGLQCLSHTFTLLQYQVKALNFTMVLYEDDSAVWLNSDEELVHEEENEEASWG